MTVRGRLHSSDLQTVCYVEGVAFGGDGVARLADGRVCFIPRVLPGERVAVRVRKAHKSYVEAEVEKVLEASPDRVRPPCPHYDRCGGCAYQHAAYARQVEIKTAQLRDILKRIGGIDEGEVLDTVPSPLPLGYRNRITVHARHGKVGFFSRKSRRVISIGRCLLASEEVNTLLLGLHAGSVRDGNHTLRERSDFRGFRQVNSRAAELLVGIARDWARPGGRLLVDAFCGAGFFAKALRDLFSLTIGIEWSADAVRAARERVADDEIYLLGEVTRHLEPALAAAPPADTTLLIDPPAEGLDADVIALLAARRPGRILYVSCNPPTFARDARRLSEAYRFVRAQGVDMFAQTSELEMIAELLPR